MIALRRPAHPAVLVRRAGAATATLRTAWTSGQTPKVLKSLYGHAEVKQALKTAQHDKCAYCETRDARSPGAVEHYRPKGGWRQNKGDTLQPPGYFWLAYRWKNLLFACTMCNDGGHKENRFPLDNPATRATPSAPSIRRESPLLLDPYSGVDPSRHIEWNADVPRTHAASPRGAATIDVFGLDRDRGLIDRRRDVLRDATFAVTQVEQNTRPGSLERAALRAVFLRYLEDSAEYAAMLRANLRQRIHAL